MDAVTSETERSAPEPGLGWSRRLALVLSFVLIIASPVLAFLSLQQLRGTAGIIDRRTQLLLPMTRLSTHLRDIDLSHRAYLASGVEAVLEPYETARLAIPAALEQIRTQIHDNPEHVANFARIEPLVGEMLALVEASLARYRADDTYVTDDATVTRGRELGEGLRAAASAMVNREVALYRHHVSTSERQARLTIAALVGFTAVALVALFMVFLLIGNEVSRRRRAESALQASNAVLEERVRERTADLERELAARIASEQKLRQMQRMDALGQLTGGIAHDFNNLLGIVIGNLDLVGMTGKPDAQTQELIDAALQGAERGAGLVQRLLAFARKQPLESQTFDVNELLKAIAPLLTRTLGEHIIINIVARQGLWSALADPSQVEDAIVNLAINARDAMQDGGTLTIETDNATLGERYARENPDVRPGEYVLIAVSDTGTGMPPDVVRRAFEPFFTTKAAGRGTGLGLSMVYGFAKQSGGHVNIYTELGQGTTVRLYLPRSVNAVMRAMEETEVVAAGGVEHILLVEDNDSMRETAQRMLNALGYRVTAVVHAPAALAALRNGLQPDLLLTDIVMPEGKSGFDLADEVRRQWPSIRLLFTSGYATGALESNPNARRGVPILSKPFRQNDLAGMVRRALDSSSSVPA